MSDFLSNKLRWLSFIATGAVVFLHSGSAPVGNIKSYIDYMQEWTAGCCLWAVPMFFTISGILFCCSYQSKTYGSFVIGKVKSLWLPVVLWCFITEILILPTTLYEHKLPCLKALLGSLALIINVDAWIPEQSLHSVAHFWYVRDLFVWFLLAPIFGVVYKSRLLLFGLFLFACLMSSRMGAFWVWRYEFRFLWLGLAFLSLGMLIHRTKIGLSRLSHRHALILSSCFACAVVILMTIGIDTSETRFLFRLMCCALVWCVYDFFQWRRFPTILNGYFFCVLYSCSCIAIY